MAARHGATTTPTTTTTTKELMHRLGHASATAALRYQRAEQGRDAALAAAKSAAVGQLGGTTSA